MINVTKKDIRKIPTITIHIGGIHPSNMPVRITTVLGSCISACLHDPSTRIGGMNRFLLPGEPDSLDMSTRYGVNAMEMLINEMMRIGANRLRLKAKVFGGADIFRANHKLMMVGKRNIGFIREFLKAENIPIVIERVGGNEGLVVHYASNTFDVFVKPIPSTHYRMQEEEKTNFYKKVSKELADRESQNVTFF